MVKVIKQPETIDTLTEKINKLETELEPLRKQLSTLQSKVMSRYNKQEKLKELLSKLVIHDITIKSEDEQIIYALEETGYYGMERYRFSTTFINSYGIHCSGYYPEIEQRALTIGVIYDSDESYDKMLTALKKFIPFIKNKEVKFKNGNLITGKVFSIFDEGLCEFNSYVLIIDSDINNKTPYMIDEMYSYGNNIRYKTDTLEDVLKQIQKEYYSSKDKEY